MHLDLSIAEAVDLMRAADVLPRFITRVVADGDRISYLLDLRMFEDPPPAIRLIAKVTPTVEGVLRDPVFADGCVVFVFDSPAGGPYRATLREYQLARVEAYWRTKGIGPGAARLLPRGRIAFDLRLLPAAALPRALRRTRIEDISFDAGRLRIDATFDAGRGR